MVIRKLILAGVLLAASVLLPQPTKALTCCQRCSLAWNACYNGCAGDPTCLEECTSRFHSCREMCADLYGEPCI